MRRPCRTKKKQKKINRKKKSVTDSVNTTAQGDEDFYDDASSLFPKAEHLAPAGKPFGPGRLVAIWPTGVKGTRKGTNGQPYTWVETVTLVLDESPNDQDWLTGQNGWDSQAAELVGPAPFRLDKFQHSTTGLVARLEKRIDGKNQAGVPLRFRPMIGRMNTQPSSVNKNVAAFSISEMTDEDRQGPLQRHKALIISINKELEAAAKNAEDSAAFDV